MAAAVAATAGECCAVPSVADFRTAFPAFADDTIYPDAMVAAWLDLGQGMVNDAWGQFCQLGIMLWAAHELAKMQEAAQQAAGGNPSGVGGIVQSKSVGPVSVSYDTQLGQEEGAGQYNLTIYGRQYWQLAQLFGMGPIQHTLLGPSWRVGGGFAGIGTWTAWPGPWPFPGPAGFSS